MKTISAGSQISAGLELPPGVTQPGAYSGHYGIYDETYFHENYATTFDIFPELAGLL